LPKALEFMACLICIDFNGDLTPNWVTLLVSLLR